MWSNKSLIIKKGDIIFFFCRINKEENEREDHHEVFALAFCWFCSPRGKTVSRRRKKLSFRYLFWETCFPVNKYSKVNLMLIALALLCGWKCKLPQIHSQWQILSNEKRLGPGTLRWSGTEHKPKAGLNNQHLASIKTPEYHWASSTHHYKRNTALQTSKC